MGERNNREKEVVSGDDNFDSKTHDTEKEMDY